MVIQSNMSPQGIVDIWKETEVVFDKYNVPITAQPLDILVKNGLLHSLLKELNSVVGSSTATCIEGG
ncbi:MULTISPECIES: hypothetical protein [Bacillaceae]|uniref:hypothetical protein n=1 Tax=Bacillaceae TaxID=186817 RepID=UPI001BDEEAC5|nr:MULTISPECIES: hypothetical protein [Bacillaceae]MDX8362753.1 hypothetical protein [Cytobacillus sp. IB215316]